MRHKHLRWLATLAVVCLPLSFLHPVAGSAAGPRPLFQLPVSCGETWRLATYFGHDDYDIDLTPKSGIAWNRPIFASLHGVVSRASLDGTTGDRTPSNPNGPMGTGAGYSVVIDHDNGWRTYYFHMIEMPMVRAGQTVVTGQQLGKVGSTGESDGPHIHYEQRQDGAKVESYFNGVPSQITSDGSRATGPLYIDGPVSPDQERVSANCGAKPPVTMGDVAVVTSTASLLALFRKADGGVWGVSQSVPGGSYGQWTRLSGMNAASYPVSLVAPNGSIVVFARGTDNRLWGISQIAPGGAYGNWTQIGSGQPTFTGDPTITLSPSGQIVIYARATDGNIWGVSQLAAGGSYGTWTRLGYTNMASNPASLLAPSGLLVAIARGTDNQIWGISQTAPGGAYGNWTQIGSGQPTFLGDPSVTVSPGGLITIFGQGDDGFIWGVNQLTPGGSYGSWSRIGS